MLHSDEHHQAWLRQTLAAAKHERAAAKHEQWLERQKEKAEGSWKREEAEEHARWVKQRLESACTDQGRAEHERWLREEQPPLTARGRQAREAVQSTRAATTAQKPAARKPERLKMSFSTLGATYQA